MIRPWITVTALAVLPWTLMAMSPLPGAASPTPADTAALSCSLDAAPPEAGASEAGGSATLESPLLPPQPQAAAVCCSSAHESACAAACAPDDSLTSCFNGRCFCLCLTIN